MTLSLMFFPLFLRAQSFDASFVDEVGAVACFLALFDLIERYYIL